MKKTNYLFVKEIITVPVNINLPGYPSDYSPYPDYIVEIDTEDHTYCKILNDPSKGPIMSFAQYLENKELAKLNLNEYLEKKKKDE
jgi:hypothetical protein